MTFKASLESISKKEKAVEIKSFIDDLLMFQLEQLLAR